MKAGKDRHEKQRCSEWEKKGEKAGKKLQKDVDICVNVGIYEGAAYRH